MERKGNHKDYHRKDYQKTLATVACFSGIGLHTGAEIKVRVLPARADKGISFIRKDLPGSKPIKAVASNVVATSYATTLGYKGKREFTVSTVEHLMAALYGLGVDNAVVEVHGPEVPILDGSAEPFVRIIDEAGIKTLRKRRKYLVIKKPIKIVADGKSIELLPCEDLSSPSYSVDYTIDFAHPFLDKQSISVDLTESSFRDDVAIARTFGFLREVELLKANGLAKGGSLENAVVLDDEKVLNEEGLRCSDEFVKHKVLDLIGDLALVGAPIVGRVVAHRSGHGLNHKLVEKVLESRSKWEMVELKSPVKPEEANVSHCHEEYPLLGESLATA